MKCETLVRTEEIHGISPDPEKPDFLYQSRRGNTYCLVLKSGVLALLENVLLLYPVSQFPAKKLPANHLLPMGSHDTKTL